MIFCHLILFSDIIKNMLEKNQLFFCDAHFHYADSIQKNAFDVSEKNWFGCSCAHSKNEWEIQFSKKNDENLQNIFLSYGIHPQSANFIDIKENLSFLENLCEEKKLNAIGEIGFDFFSDELKSSKSIQEEIFIIELEIAIKYNLPVVIHCRKANEKLFEYAYLLKKVPQVLFHSFMGSFQEAQSLLKRDINAFFSFGKQMMNHNKNVILCAKNLSLENLLCETDSPFQFLKGEEKTLCSEIMIIYEEFSKIRSENLEKICLQLKNNFSRFLLIH